MAIGYKAISWNRQKKRYDGIMLMLILLYLLTFVVLSFVFHPTITPETLIIRAFGSLALVMLHVVLLIGPLTRLNPKFLPFLYNRRHLGVTMFLMAAVHGVFSIIQFHSLGNTNALLSVFTANLHYDSLANFPFQVLGFIALFILFLMAASSHDFWLKNLSPNVWKTLHMMVYVAYGLILMHVLLGVAQVETSPVLVGLLAIGFLTVAGLHLFAGLKAFRHDRLAAPPSADMWRQVCHVDEIDENRAKVITTGKQSIAVFRYGNQLSAIANVCKHQGGPLGEGKIIDGCVTCPWHGYQYIPENGCSPPPFEEKVATYDVRIENGMVLVNPAPHPEGTAVVPCTIETPGGET